MSEQSPTMIDIMWSHYEKTLRDEFAKAALEGFLSNQSINLSKIISPEKLTENAYIFADCMLAARQKVTP